MLSRHVSLGFAHALSGQPESCLDLEMACRYVDMIVTEGVRAALRTRAQVSVCMRRVLDEQGFIEIETPMLEASAGGADARPFVTWHNALQRPYVLRIATYASRSLPSSQCQRWQMFNFQK